MYIHVNICKIYDVCVFIIYIILCKQLFLFWMRLIIDSTKM